MNCPRCGSDQVQKFGTRGDKTGGTIQRFRCRNRNHRWEPKTWSEPGDSEARAHKAFKRRRQTVACALVIYGAPFAGTARLLGVHPRSVERWHSQLRTDSSRDPEVRAVLAHIRKVRVFESLEEHRYIWEMGRGDDIYSEKLEDWLRDAKESTARKKHQRNITKMMGDLAPDYEITERGGIRISS